MVELEQRAAEAEENVTQLARANSELESTLAALQKALGAEDPKVFGSGSVKVFNEPIHFAHFHSGCHRWLARVGSAAAALRAAQQNHTMIVLLKLLQCVSGHGGPAAVGGAAAAAAGGSAV